MPLSEDDQRIFSEIERTFYASDPGFARRLSGSISTANASRNIKLGIFGFVVGLAMVITLFTVSPILGFAGFAVMVGSGVLVVDNARRIGKERLQAIQEKVQQSRAAGTGIRDRFRRNGGNTNNSRSP